MTLEGFRDLYPEFQQAPDPLVEALLTQTEKGLSLEIWGERFDEIHGLETANALALRPDGISLRLEGGTVSIYQSQIDQLRLAVVPGFMVV
jgi:hypothetical protein